MDSNMTARARGILFSEQMVRAILKQHGPDAFRPKELPRKPASKRRRAITFGSETERRVHQLLSLENPVFVHPKIVLDAQTTFTPDMIEAVVVNRAKEPIMVRLQPGEFIGRCIDAKGERKNKRGERKVHVEREFAAKRKWLRAQTGIKVDLATLADGGNMVVLHDSEKENHDVVK